MTHYTSLRSVDLPQMYPWSRFEDSITSGKNRAKTWLLFLFLQYGPDLPGRLRRKVSLPGSLVIAFEANILHVCSLRNMK